MACLAERDGRYLLVEEHTPEGLRLNNPAGHLEPGESLVQAAAREALEAEALDRYFALRPGVDRVAFMADYAGLAALNEARIIGIFARLIARDGICWSVAEADLQATGFTTIADAILDRLMQHHHRFTLSGESLRQNPRPPRKEKTDPVIVTA